MSSRLSICVLTFADYVEQAARCLNSLMGHSAKARRLECLLDIRIGQNSPSTRLREFVDDWARQAAFQFGARVMTLRHDTNRLKYPMMRAMFHAGGRHPAELVMWFDDDSYLSAAWEWQNCLAAMADHAMIGQPWHMPFQGRQLDWLATQDWFSLDKVNGRRTMRFCQGAWWVARRDVLAKYNWPLPELRHKGGDSLLGELLCQQGLSMGRFDRGVRINADASGRHSKAPRRDLSLEERELGVRYDGRPLPTDHQLPLHSVEIRTYEPNSSLLGG